MSGTKSTYRNIYKCYRSTPWGIKVDLRPIYRGKVFVFSGILPICTNEDGLATVLGHEIAHNVAHHLQESASLPYLFTLIVELVTFFFDNSAQLTQLVLNYGLDLPNSRAQEVS